MFNLVEELNGEVSLNYTPGFLLRSLAIPFTGCPPEALLVTTDKLVTKRILRAVDIPTPAWVSLIPADEPFRDPAAQYLLKPVHADASQGIFEEQVRLAVLHEDLFRELAQAEERTGREWFAEAFIGGREFNISVLETSEGPVVLPPAEIRFDDFPEDKLKIVGYRAKWDESSFEYHHTPRTFDFSQVDEFLLSQLKEIALKCWQLFKLRGYCRVDFRIDEAGQPWVLEINSNPCISPDAGFVAAAARAGRSYSEVLDCILHAAVADTRGTLTAPQLLAAAGG